MTINYETRLALAQYEYTSKAELRRLAVGALTELIVTRELLRREKKND